MDFLLTCGMQLFLMFGVLAIITAFALLVVFSSMRGRQTWKSVAEDLGLTYTPSLMAGKKLRGQHRGFDIRIDEVSEGNHGKKLVVQVSGVDPGFTLGRDSALLRMIKPDIETGDQHFDQRTRIEGDADWALALLDDDARRLVETVVSGWNGELKRTVLSASYKKIEDTASRLETVLDLAQRLRRPAPHELPKLLMKRARHDPSSPVRLQALRRLAASNAFQKEALATAETLLESSSDALKLEACRLLVGSSSEKSDLAAKDLAGLATWHWVDSSVRRSALETLAESRYRRSAIGTMGQLLRQSDTPTRIRSTALDGLIRAGARSELLAVRTDGAVEAEILARGLGRFDASVQPRLLQLLDDSTDRVRMAAVRSLGQVGDLDAIRVLRQVAGQDRLFKSALARESELAITQIKSRSDGSQHGEISIIQVAPLEGAISPSDEAEAGGEISLTS